MMKILYLFPNPSKHLPRREILKRHLEGNFPDTLLMGLTHLDKFGAQWALLDLERRTLDQIRGLLMSRYCDIAVCKDATSGLLLGIFKKLGLIKKPVVFLDVVVHDGITGLRLNFIRWVFSGADKIVYCALFLKETLKQRFMVDEKKMQYISWAVDDAFFRPMNLEPGQFILSVGDNSRDYDTLIEAVKDMPLRLKIITNMRLRKNHHCNIETRPWLQPVLLREEYARARFVVVPLHDVPSASGATALLEAMAMGKAVIVSDSRGIRDFVKDGQDAVVVRSGDAGLLRQAILRLDSDAEERKRIGLLARRAVVENFGTAKQAAALAKIYRELLRA